MPEEKEATLRGCCRGLVEWKGKLVIVGESGFGWGVWRGVAIDESDGEGVSTARLWGGSSWGLSFSWRASMTRRGDEGDYGRGERGGEARNRYGIMGGGWC
jgi:hypothetical protein